MVPEPVRPTTGITSTVVTDATYDLQQPAISGDWMVWLGTDIHAKNLKTGVKKNVTNDGGTTVELAPQSVATTSSGRRTTASTGT